MKKRIVVLLCIILILSLLCACQQSKQPDEPTEPTTQQPESLFFHLDSLPDIGERKDNSFVNKYFGGEAKNEFIPDENYKGIVPYAFSQQIYSTYSEGWSSLEYSYGLATTEGEIITNGIYQTVSLETSSDNKQVYICNERSADKNDSDTFVDVIAPDGSWKIRVKVPEFGEVSTDCDLITVMEGVGSKVYDFDGKFIFDSQELFGKGYTAIASEKAGDHVIFKVFDGDDAYFNTGSAEYDYEFHTTVYAACVDRSGKIVYTLKPEDYRYSSVCGEYFKFIKIEPIYDDDGNSYSDNYYYSLFDKNGKKILDDCSYIKYDEISGLYVLTPSKNASIDEVNDSSALKIVDRNMKEVCQIETNDHYSDILRCNNESCLAVHYYADDEDSGGISSVYLYDLKTGKEIELPRYSENHSFEMSTLREWKGNEYILINDGQGVGIYDAAGKCLKKLTAPNVEIYDIECRNGIFNYVADSKLYVETFDSCAQVDLKPDGSYNSYVEFTGGDLIYLTSENTSSASDYLENEKTYFVYNKSTGELKKSPKIIGIFNTQNGFFTAEETDYYLELLNENGECIIRKSKSF